MYKKSFTLIEMMIVVAIIAVLAGVALPQYSKYVRKAEASHIITMLNKLKEAEEIYKAVHGKYLYFGAAGYNTSISKQLAIKKMPLMDFKNDYDYYVNYCRNTIPGTIMKIRKIGGKFVYMVIPPNMTLSSSSDPSLINNSFFIYDYINDENSDKKPSCYD